MAGETPITVVGNLTADPELRFTPSGAAVANFTVASTPRTFDRQTNEWKDAETLFMRCSVWREAAENVSESLHRGTRVVVTGRLVSRSWQTQEGENRTVMEMQVDEIGPSLRYATAQVTKAQRGGGQQGGWGGGQQGGQSAPQQGQSGGWGQQQGGQSAPQQGQSAPQGGQQAGGDADPWATGGQSGQQSGGWGGAPSYDEPPF
ncbi:MAG: single-stranded DNA-binding protein [Acidobacteria bacterium]|nr:MAG: single-stranded DNA-binding protein [Acidobacteriota bacterium]